MRLISANVNGIRAASRKGFLPWVAGQSPDFVCMQEVRAHREALDAATLNPTGLFGHFHHAHKKGYSGCGVYTCHRTDDVRCGFGHPELDAEGRCIEVRMGKLSVLSVYVPSGGASQLRHEVKMRYLAALSAHLQQLKLSGQEVVLCGDMNIAHQQCDLKDWKSNMNISGFLPEERAWMSHLLDEVGFVDIFRKLHPFAQNSGYTWWSNHGKSFENNNGWRIDYQLATPGIASSARKAHVFKEQRFSDHAPLVVHYDWTLQ